MMRLKLNISTLMKGLLSGLLFYCSTVAAEVVPSLDLTLYYNDNITLAQGDAKQDSYITEVSPGLRYQHDGRQIDAFVDYHLQSLFMDVSANRSQEFVSMERAVALDNLSGSANRTNVTTYAASPYVRHRFGNIANAELRYRYSTVRYEDEFAATQGDSNNNSAKLDIKNGSAFDKTFWHYTVNYNNRQFLKAPDVTLRSVMLESGYRLSTRISLLADVGYEKNDYENAFITDKTSGAIWNLGFTWSPDGHNRVEAKGGRRYFGSTSSLVIDHSTQYSVWNIRYKKDITTAAQIQAQQQEQQLQLLQNGEVEPGEGSQQLLPRSSAAILQDNLNMSVRYEHSKTYLAASVYYSKREFQDTGFQDKMRGANFTWRWHFLPRTSASLTSSGYTLDFAGVDRIDRVSQSTIRLERQIQPKITGTVGYGLLDRNSTDDINDYTRKLYSVSVKAEF